MPEYANGCFTVYFPEFTLASEFTVVFGGSTVANENIRPVQKKENILNFYKPVPSHKVKGVTVICVRRLGDVAWHVGQISPERLT